MNNAATIAVVATCALAAYALHKVEAAAQVKLVDELYKLQTKDQDN